MAKARRLYRERCLFASPEGQPAATLRTIDDVAAALEVIPETPRCGRLALKAAAAISCTRGSEELCAKSVFDVCGALGMHYRPGPAPFLAGQTARTSMTRFLGRTR